MKQNDAVKIVKKSLVSDYGETIKRVDYVNDNKHTIIRGEKNNYYVLMKREPFYSFGKIFSTEGAGETINKKWLKKAVKNDCILLFVYEDKIYSIHSKRFKRIAEENDYTRATKEGEFTCHVPIDELERFDG